MNVFSFVASIIASCMFVTRDTLTLLLWAKVSSMLAIGTAKGNLLLYNHQTSRSVPDLLRNVKHVVQGEQVSFFSYQRIFYLKNNFLTHVGKLSHF